MKLGDYLNAINHTKENLLDSEDELVEKKYVPFVVNRCLSYFPDTILHVNEMNRYSSTEKKMQFDYLVGSIRKRKRFSKWLKTEQDERVEVIKKVYNYSDRSANDVKDLFTDDQIEDMKQFLDPNNVSKM